MLRQSSQPRYVDATLGQAMASRRAVLCAALASTVAPAFSRYARAADADRFPLGSASGIAQTSSVVLWTHVMGAELPNHVDVKWEVAHDEAFTHIAACGSECVERKWVHSVHAKACKKH